MRSDKPVNLDIAPLERTLGVVAKELARCDKPGHGAYASITSSKSSVPSGCPVCAEEARRVADEAEQGEQRARAVRERMERRLGEAMIPKRFQGKRFDAYRAETPEQQQALRICEAYARDFPQNYEAGRCLLLLGTVGTGKTHLANAILHEVVTRHGMLGVYRTVTGILQYVKGSYDHAATYSEAEAFQALVAPHLLVIDEAGATKATEFELATLFTVINGRYEQQKPTVVISNLELDGLHRAIGDRCVDRLREGGGRMVPFKWQSARRGVA
ncbi:ATP-binding protein [Pseudomonas fulva]|uniref:ATP-binding protein n=1 Tax=Pseudomonas fulva TaxID=47880 RepID=UPI00201D65B8|nr:ATP-binding protein [Pseudomonas fulva]UQY33571.1 ATP-binding protein [Pseudomonas fulva]